MRNRHSNLHPMDLLTKITTLIIFTASLLLLGCGGDSDANSNAANSNSAQVSNTNTTKDNVEELRSLIRIPFEPDEVVYRVLNEADKKQRLVAVFVLTPEIHKSLEGRIASSGAAKDQLITVEQWF